MAGDSLKSLVSLEGMWEGAALVDSWNTAAVARGHLEAGPEGPEGHRREALQKRCWSLP